MIRLVPRSKSGLRLASTKPACRLPVVLHARVSKGPGGGPDKTILNSPRFLTPVYRTLCAYMHPPGDRGFEKLRAKAAAWRAPLLSVDDRGPWDWHVVTQLLHICRKERVSIWHGHDYKSNALGLLLRRFWPMHLVTTVHGWGVEDTRRASQYYRIDRLCLPYYDRVICVSEDLYEQCLGCGVPAERCTLIENAIDVDEYARCLMIDEAKARLGLPTRRWTIGAVGRLSAEKGFDALIRSVHELLRAGLDVSLLIVGEGEQRRKLEGLIAALGAQDRIRLLGYRADTRDCYEAMDVFALPSYREGLPNALLEAMAMSVPVVATRIAGIPRVIEHEANGLLVRPGAVEELAAALANVLHDAGLRDLLGRQARRTIETRYSFSVRMQKIRAEYDRLRSRC